ncbi:Uncharacterised protein [Pseudomonas aeruginosa]|nr:Uncharacterised protein [Pseudomonas aeruginosa]
MATEFGTAANHADLVERLVQFLTANPTLVAAGQAYEKTFDNTIPASGTAIAIRQVTLRAPGLGGDDSIFMGVQSYGDTALDYYNVRLMGGTAFNPGALPPGGDFWTAFVNYSPRVQLLAWNQPMPYWFFANGRRFWLVVKVSHDLRVGRRGLHPATPVRRRSSRIHWLSWAPTVATLQPMVRR